MATLDQKVKASILNVIALSNMNKRDTEFPFKPETITTVKNDNPFPMLPAATISERPAEVVIPKMVMNGNTRPVQFPIPQGHVPPGQSVISKHPFLGYSPNPPNGGTLVTSLKDLEDIKVDYTQLLTNAGIIQQKPVIAINIDLYSEQIQQALQNIKLPPVHSVSTVPTVQVDLSDIKLPSVPTVPTVHLPLVPSVTQTDRMVYNVPSFEVNIDQSWTLLDIITKKPIQEWHQVFQESYNDLVRINNYLLDIERQGGMWFPLKKNLFRSIELLPPKEVKVVIIGQDPYPGTGPNGDPIAIGLSFATEKQNKIPASLSGVYKVMQKTIVGWQYPSHGDLTCWVKHGVLLLNKCLTLNPGAPGSHKDLWGEFVTRIIHYLDKVNPNCVYLLWGNHAQEMTKYISSKHVLMSSHPSPMGIYHGFINCNHFNEANDILIAQKKSPIDWNVY